MSDPKRFTIRTDVDPDFLDEVDDWIREQTVPPSRAAAIRYLVRRGIEADRDTVARRGKAREAPSTEN